MSLIDILQDKVTEKKCLDHGHVTLIDVMPRIVTPERPTCDYAITESARVSYAGKPKSDTEERGLIRYLMRHKHTSPLEQVELKFNIKLPIFVARQAVRTRCCSLNEISGRYTQLKDEFYIPSIDEVRTQSKNNKQGSDEPLNEIQAQDFIDRLKGLCQNSYASYESDIKNGMAKELARTQLPVNIYTEWYWKIDLKNLLDFLALRCDSHAQYEIRVYAEAMLELIRPLAPWTIEAWEDYHPMRGAVTLSRLEVEALKKILTKKLIAEQLMEFVDIDSDNQRERKEWEEKINLLMT